MNEKSREYFKIGDNQSSDFIDVKKEKEVYSKGEIQNLKNKIEKLDPHKLIEDALKLSKKGEEKKEKRDDYLDNMKSNAIKSFLDNAKNRSLKEISVEFERRLEDYNKASLLYKDKIDKENHEYKSLNLASKQKIEQLETTVIQFNQENTILNEQIKSTTKTLDKLQLKFTDFEKYKPIFEQFFKEFPDDDPVKIIQDIKTKKEASIKIIEESNEYQYRIIQLEKDKKDIYDRNRRVVEDLSIKLSRMENENMYKVEEYVKEIKVLKDDVSGMKNIKVENQSLKFMLFHLYNHLIERLKLDKNLKIDPALKVEERDFTPNLFDNTDIIKYIKAMLNTSSEEKSAQILREVIAYSNMMLRNFMKDKLHNKWNPVQIFKDIKDLIEKLQLDKFTHEQTIIRMKDSIAALEFESKKLHKEIKHRIGLYETLERKYAEQFDERLKKLRENKKHRNNKREVIEIDDKKHNEEHSKERSMEVNNRSGEILKSFESKKEMLDIKVVRPLTATVKHRMASHKEGKRKDLFVTNDTKRPGTSNTFRPSTTKSRPKFSASTRPQTGKTQIMSVSKKVKAQSSMIITSMLKKQQNGTHKKALSEFNTDRIAHENDEVLSPVKNLKLSKNGDRLMVPGRFTILENHKDGLINLVENTNKLFLLKEKTREYSGMTENNMFNKFKKHIDSNIHKLNQISAKINKPYVKNDDITVQISQNINNLIRNLEEK